MSFQLGSSSRANLAGGSKPIQAIVNRAIAITDVDFSVIQTLRSYEEQVKNVENGVSSSLESYHLPQNMFDNEANPVSEEQWYAEAVDIYPWVDGETNHGEEYYRRVAKAMFQAAFELGYTLEWGGFWHNPDSPHWQRISRLTA